MLKLGCAKVDITPKAPVYLRGYGSRNALSKGVEDRLSAGVLLLRQGRTTQAILTIDSLGLGILQCRRIYADIERATGLKAAQTFLSCSHTHFAPGLDDYCVIMPDGELPQGVHSAEKEYYLLFIKQVIKGIRKAADNLEAVELEEAAVQLPSLLFNRRTIRRSDGMVDTNYLYPKNPDDYLFQPTDSELMVWRFKAAGRLKAVVGRFSCHPVTGGRDIYLASADYPGYFQSLVQQYLGCPGFFLLGSAGDAVPLQRNGESRRDIGETMVRSIRMAERTFRKAADFRLEGRVLDVPVTLRVKCPRQDIDGYLAKVFKENSGKNFDVERVIRGTYEAEFAATYPEDRFSLPLRLLRLGSKVLVGMPFEVLTEIGLRLKRACPNAELISITGGYEGYLPLAKEYRRGGYEATLGPRFHRRAGDDFLAAAIAAVNAFEKGSAKE